MLCWASFIKIQQQSVINPVTELCSQEAGAPCWDLKHSVPTNATGLSPLPCIPPSSRATATYSCSSLSGNEMYFYIGSICFTRYILGFPALLFKLCIWDGNTSQAARLGVWSRMDCSRGGLFTRAEVVYLPEQKAFLLQQLCMKLDLFLPGWKKKTLQWSWEPAPTDIDRTCRTWR